MKSTCAKSHFPSPRSASRDSSATCTRPVHRPPGHRGRSPGGHTPPTPDVAGRPVRRGIDDHATTMRRRAVPTSAVRQNRWISATQKDGENCMEENLGYNCINYQQYIYDSWGCEIMKKLCSIMRNDEK